MEPVRLLRSVPLCSALLGRNVAGLLCTFLKVGHDTNLDLARRAAPSGAF
jgi:hypothetical protein